MKAEINSGEDGKQAFPLVIVRALGDEPKTLYAVGMQANQCYVNVTSVPPSTAILGWPLGDTFDYDVNCYAELVKAFDAKDADRLTSLYSELCAKPKEFVSGFTSTPVLPVAKSDQ